MPRRRNKVLSFITPTGIGDFSWIYSKLVSLNRPLAITIRYTRWNRLFPFLDLLPKVVKAQYGHVCNPAKVRRRKAHSTWPVRRLVRLAGRAPLRIELNTWLEHGNRIEDFIPDLPADLHYQLPRLPKDVETVNRALLFCNRFVCFYSGHSSAVRRWRAWGPDNWARLAELLRNELDVRKFVIIGKDWDRPFSERIERRMKVQFRNLVGQLSLGASLEVLRRSMYVVAFPSGIPILATVLRRPTLMFYPPRLRSLQYAWAPKEMIESGAYKAMQFPTPEAASDWISNGYGLPNREDEGNEGWEDSTSIKAVVEAIRMG